MQHRWHVSNENFPVCLPEPVVGGRGYHGPSLATRWHFVEQTVQKEKKKGEKDGSKGKKKAKAQDSVAMLFLVSGGAVYADVTQNRICRIGANISLLFPCPQAR